MSSTRASIHTDERLQYRPKRCEFHSFDKLLRHRENVFDSQFEVDIRSREPEAMSTACDNSVLLGRYMLRSRLRIATLTFYACFSSRLRSEPLFPS